MAVNFEDLEARAAKRTAHRNRAPYVINVKDDDPIEIKYPDSIASMEYERATSVYDQLRILTESDFPRILDLVRGKDISVVQLLITEMWAFWGDDSREVPGGKRGLIELFDQYGREILLDFRSYWSGLDVLDYFTGDRSWFEFYDFLFGLPSWSRFQAKMALDPAYAEMIHQRKLEAGEYDNDDEDDSDEGWKPETRSQEGFSPVIATMYTAIESINEVSRTLIAVHGTKPPNRQKLPRPFSALDLLELEDERDDMHDLAARFGMKQPG
ncbi:tail assembly chaperone [Gordonia phage NatB6]|uniref:Tail assembly chaperone n=1 Tax=Gordonia phage NatB6 TaxID=2250322 RepID=A0A345L4W5_9CAUD|nr:tail assembly chaperone [Gordonia phage NatB6]AXH50317.1 tail assembly chaperone [Gordonia phage NatB6]